MDFFAYEEQNWANLLVLIASVFSSFFGSVVNNRSNANRYHNIIKLVNEGLSRGNLVFISFFATMGLLRTSDNMGKYMLFALLFFSIFVWVVGLLVNDHIIQNSFPKWHTCSPREGSEYHCKTVPSIWYGLRLTWGSILIFFVMSTLAVAVSFSRWTNAYLSSDSPKNEKFEAVPAPTPQLTPTPTATPKPSQPGKKKKKVKPKPSSNSELPMHRKPGESPIDRSLSLNVRQNRIQYRTRHLRGSL